MTARAGTLPVAALAAILGSAPDALASNPGEFEDFSAFARHLGLRLQSTVVASATNEEFLKAVMTQAAITKADYYVRLLRNPNAVKPLPRDTVAKAGDSYIVVVAAASPESSRKGVVRAVVFDESTSTLASIASDVVINPNGRARILPFTSFSASAKSFELGRDYNPEHDPELGLEEAVSARKPVSGFLRNFLNASHQTGTECGLVTDKMGLCIASRNNPGLTDYAKSLEMIFAPVSGSIQRVSFGIPKPQPAP